ASAESEANAAITIDKQDRPWIAYDQMGVGWGKDQGSAIRQTQPGIPLNRKRQVRVVVRTANGFQQPAEQPSAAMPAGNQDDNELPRLYTDAGGRIWIEYRHKTERPATWSRPGRCTPSRCRTWPPCAASGRPTPPTIRATPGFRRHSCPTARTAS